MDVASVTLDEVLRAARARSAALVPETSGYLALAIGDASARLPYRIEDDLVTVTTEGTVRVARGKESVSPEEGARVLREHLHRLLSVSAGSMPGLAQAGAPRREVGGPETVVAEIESALIPCNRAAARRSLARLARDASRARDAGRLAPHVPPLSRGPRNTEAKAAPRPAPPHPPSQPAIAHAAPSTYEMAQHPQVAPHPYANAGAPSVHPAHFAHAEHHAAPGPYAVQAPMAQAPMAQAPMAHAHPVHGAYVPVAGAYGAMPQTVYAVAESYAPEHHAPEHHAPVPAPYPHAPSYGAIEVAPPAFEVDVDVDVDDGLVEAHQAADDLTNRIDLAALGFEPSDATTIDSIEVIEASFERIEAAMAHDADATPRLGTGWPTHVARPATLDGALGEHLAAAMASPAPAAVVLAPRVDEAARSLEAALDAGRLATPRPRKAEPPLKMRRLPWQADLGRARKSDVGDLLARFGASDPRRDSVAMRRDIKRTIGIDATQLPPSVATRDR